MRLCWGATKSIPFHKTYYFFSSYLDMAPLLSIFTELRHVLHICEWWKPISGGRKRLKINITLTVTHLVAWIGADPNRL